MNGSGYHTEQKALTIVSLSGGKDSTATALLAIERHGPDDVRLVFADTGHEHPLTIEYVTGYLPRRLNLPVEVVKADFNRQMAGKRAWIETHWAEAGVPDHRIARALELLRPTGIPFLDLCLWKGRFPSRKAQFCTEQLKKIPLDRYMNEAPYRYAEDGREIPNESWRGVRRDESEARKEAPEDAIDSTPGGRLYRIVQPIVTWTANDVFAYIAASGLDPNPLYKLNMRRVGCMPCVNCTKDELLEVGKRWPWVIDILREWEVLVAAASKRGLATFFPDPVGDGPKKEVYQNIDDRLAWAKTSRGGKQYDLLRSMPATSQCSSVYGLCE